MVKVVLVLLCVLYVVSPVDLLPEAVLGPFGLPDDFVAAMVGFRTLMSK